MNDLRLDPDLELDKLNMKSTDGFTTTRCEACGEVATHIRIKTLETGEGWTQAIPCEHWVHSDPRPSPAGFPWRTRDLTITI
jgi:hypothetical protein